MGRYAKKENMINWQYFPRSDSAPSVALQVVESFEAKAQRIDSSSHELVSNEVLAEVSSELENHGFEVESGKKAEQKIQAVSYTHLTLPTILLV